MRKIFEDSLATLQLVAGLPTDAPDPLAATAPLVTIPEQLQLIMGQTLPSPAAGQQWQMSNNALYYFSRALDVRLVLVEQARATQQQVDALQQQLIDRALSGLGATRAESAALRDGVDVLRASLELVRAAGLATQSQLEANAAGDIRLALRVQATEQQQAADKLADAARDQHLASQDAQLALLAARAGADETLIATLQTKTEAAQASATQAISDAAVAQSKATLAKAAADAAQKTADAATAQAATNATALAAVQADVATRLPAAMVQRFTINTPQVTIQVGVPATFSVPLPKAFADNQYLVFFTPATGAALLNVRLGDTAKLPGSFTATMQQTGAVSLLVPASSAEVLVFHL